MATPTPTHIVLRKFSGPGSTVLEPGTLVAADAWKNLQGLETLRMVRRLDYDEGASIAKDAKGQSPKGRKEQ